MAAAESKPLILIVDDAEANIDVLVEVLGEDYDLSVATNGPDALEAAEQDLPDLILLDIMMPGMSGYEVCLRLKAEKATAKVPVVFVTAMGEVEDETKGFSVGAVDYITKPISPPIVKARVKTHLALADQQRTCERTIEKQVSEIKQGQKDAIFMLGQAGHYNDDHTGVHIWRMAAYAAELARAAKWPVEKQQLLRLSAPMHDTGKIGIPDSILKKPARLTDEEWVTMREHSAIGHRILSVSKTPLFSMAAEIALYHHERWGGGGYPEDLSGKDIPESARIVAIADVFDALTMRRPYKEPWPVERALDEIRKDKGHFEPRLAELFLSLEDRIIEIMHYWNEKEKSMGLQDEDSVFS